MTTLIPPHKLLPIVLQKKVIFFILAKLLSGTIKAEPRVLPHWPVTPSGATDCAAATRELFCHLPVVQITSLDVSEDI